MATDRRGFLRWFGIGAAGVGAAAIGDVTNAFGAAKDQAAAERVVEKIVEVPVPVPVAGGLVWAREAFGYGAQELEAGEVFALTGLRNDLLLTNQGYARVIGTLGIVLCNCGRRFVFDNRGHNYMVDHCARTGHRPANLVGPAFAGSVTVVDETRVGELARRREVTVTVDALTISKGDQVELVARLRDSLERPAAEPARLSEAIEAIMEPAPEILEVGGTLRPSLVTRERQWADRHLRRRP